MKGTLTTNTNKKMHDLKDVVKNKTIAGQKQSTTIRNVTTSTYIDAICLFIAFVGNEALYNEANKVYIIYQGMAKSPSFMIQIE